MSHDSFDFDNPTKAHWFSVWKRARRPRVFWFWFFGWRMVRLGYRRVGLRVCARCGVSEDAAWSFGWDCETRKREVA